MSRFTRGIFGQKPTTAGSSDIVSVDQQYSASVSGTWPATTSSTSFVAAESFSIADCGMLTYSKKSDGLYYPGVFIESSGLASYASITNGSYATISGTVYGLSVAKGGTHAAVIIATSTPYTQDVFVWKNVPYGNTYIWRYVGILSASGSGVTSTGSVQCVAFHPSGNYIVFGTNTGGAGITLYAYSRSGDTFTALSNPPTPSATGHVVYAVEWNAAGTSLAVSISASPFIVIYNFSNGTFTKLSAPATLPTGYTLNLAWNPSGTTLFYQAYSTTAARMYNRSGDTFTAISGLPVPFISNASCYSGGASWNNNGTLLAMTNNSGDCAVYYRSGDSFSALSIPSPLYPGSVGKQAQFNPSGKELLVTQDASLDIWDVNGTTITRRTTSPFGAYSGRVATSAPAIYGSRMGATYGGGDTYVVFSPTAYVRWITSA